MLSKLPLIRSKSLLYYSFMRLLFDIQVLPLNDISGSTARDLGPRGINGTYANTAGMTLNNDLPPFKAVTLGATSYVNHNAANIAAYFSYLTGSYHYWAKASLASWDEAVLRRMAFFQVNTSNRIDVSKLSGSDTLTFDYRVGGVSNAKTINNFTYTSGWIPFGLRWDKSGDAFDIFVNGHNNGTVTGLGDLAGAVATALIGGNPYLPSFSLAYLGLGSSLVTDAQFKLLAGRVPRDKLIVCDGDSLTYGGQLGAVPYPKQLMRLFYSDTPVPNNAGYNCGNSGEQIETMITSAPTTVDIYRGDLGFSQYVCVFWGGTNDINGAESAAEVEGEIQAYCLAR